MRMGGGRFAGANPLRPGSLLENSRPGPDLNIPLRLLVRVQAPHEHLCIEGEICASM